MPYDIDAAEDWLDDWTASVSAQAERAAELSRRVAALTGTAESRDGSIKVTVGSSGQVESLELTGQPELARRVMDVMRDAQAQLAGRVAGQVEQTVGSDTETGRAVIHSFESRFPERTGDPEPDDGR
ncbi:YbaB/EbfC family nucleoid-associated protein [Actinoplanes bogorensis]|uniref:YbaB/EbfC family nucleoid-associated protein n=1 Tax=Paractinoplanes bogorensis TaxID=1610840 RepID=A0ABS5Z3E5_9ACTN|nr:YbaB/EbfC family nucleoid-associated protein [Actinoplanes bogorensis]MBU2670225.1 YbaB/EbfC family nucleoid-associated protein [Actinoplanes bogorensis]